MTEPDRPPDRRTSASPGFSGSDPELRIVRYHPGGERPCLRPVEAVQVETPDGKRIVLRDPAGFADSTLLLSVEALSVAALMNGMRTVAQIQRELARRSGGTLVYSDRIAGLAKMLAAHGFLEGPQFEERRTLALVAYRALERRAARHAGQAYPGDPAELKARIESYYTHPLGPGRAGVAGTGAKKLSGLISPHIDLHRGGPAYAHAYKALLESSDADLFVVFGTAHASPNHLFTLTHKDYDTPLGPVPTDRALVDGLVERLGPGLVADELVHRTEHSIEFQAVFLRYLFPEREVRMLPVLTSNLYDCHDPSRDERIERFLEGLADVVAGRNVLYIAAADLAHVGRMFGDEKGPTANELAVLAQRDQRTLSLACTGDVEGFFHDVRPDAETRRICGLTPIYMTLRACRSRSGQVLRYAQWTGDDSSVTYAAAALY